MTDRRRRADPMREEDGQPRSRFGSRGGYGRGLDGDEGRPDQAGRERDFGDSAGYGSGGSARDWRDVIGNERRGYDDPDSFFGRGSREDDRERGFLERAGHGIRSLFRDEGSGHPDHRGRGPKGYARSDERIREDLCERLTENPHLDASEIEVGVQSREVTLSGTVSTRFEKRHAEDIADAVSGVGHVQNNLRVRPAGMSADESAPTGALADSMGFGTARTGMASAAEGASRQDRRGRRS
jgi:hypothetical protein